METTHVTRATTEKYLTAPPPAMDAKINSVHALTVLLTDRTAPREPTAPMMETISVNPTLHAMSITRLLTPGASGLVLLNVNATTAQGRPVLPAMQLAPKIVSAATADMVVT
jgi:hypothetical protein